MSRAKDRVVGRVARAEQRGQADEGPRAAATIQCKAEVAAMAQVLVLIGGCGPRAGREVESHKRSRGGKGARAAAGSQPKTEYGANATERALYGVRSAL